MREFEHEAEEPTLSQYLELVTLQTNADEIDATEKLTLMTVHAAKGLEFPVVWVAGLEERIFPRRVADAEQRGPRGGAPARLRGVHARRAAAVSELRRAPASARRH